MYSKTWSLLATAKITYPGPIKFVPFTVCFESLLSEFFLHLRASSKEDVVDECILQQCQEYKDEAAHQVHVYSFDVGNLWKGLPQMSVNGGHREHGGDP